MRTNVDRVACYAAMVLALSLVTTIQSQSQNLWGQQRKQAPAIPVTELRTPVQLAGIPEFTGKGMAFKGGYVDSTSSPSGSHYFMTWYCKEPPTEVLDWYAQALGSGGWTISSRNQCNIFANKQGYTCNVRAIYFTNPNFKTELSITSFQKK